MDQALLALGVVGLIVVGLMPVLWSGGERAIRRDRADEGDLLHGRHRHGGADGQDSSGDGDD